MSKIDDDGGPAFPFPTVDRGSTCTAGPWAAAPGMTLRDYFAAHADQPGTNECYLLSVELGGPPLPEGKPHESFSYRVGLWWDLLPLARRLELYATVRWRTADAMLAARKGTA